MKKEDEVILLEALDPPPTLFSIFNIGNNIHNYRNPLLTRPLSQKLEVEIKKLPYNNGDLQGVTISYNPLPEIEWRITLSPTDINLLIDHRLDNIMTALESVGFELVEKASRYGYLLKNHPAHPAIVYQLPKYNLTDAQRNWHAVYDMSGQEV